MNTATSAALVVLATVTMLFVDCTLFGLFSYTGAPLIGRVFIVAFAAPLNFLAFVGVRTIWEDRE